MRRKGPLGCEGSFGRMMRGISDMVGLKVSKEKTTLDLWIWIQENVSVKHITTNYYLLVLTNNDKL